MKKSYQELDIELFRFSAKDVITKSGNETDEGDFNFDDDDDWGDEGGGNG